MAAGSARADAGDGRPGDGRGGTQYEVGPHEFMAIRPHVLGRFSDMLKPAALHPAMLLYLDQFQSTGPLSPFQQRRRRRPAQAGGRGGLNENLAREFLELHTLGVGGGYTQADVTELARALTGWTIPGIGRIGRFSEDQTNGAAFVALAHEPGARMILRRRYAAGGPEQALVVGGNVRGERVVADWPWLTPGQLHQGRDLAPTIALESVLAGAVAEHLGLDPVVAMARFCPGRTTRPLAGIVRA
ncbi:DUF1800 family protein [Erythrobacter sanguineus]|nr:DUF1800 family protein [Erythrobacter sanguineus]